MLALVKKKLPSSMRRQWALKVCKTASSLGSKSHVHDAVPSAKGVTSAFMKADVFAQNWMNCFVNRFLQTTEPSESEI